MSGSGVKIRTKDLIPITLLSGISVTLLLFLIFFLLIPARDQEHKIEFIYRVLSVYRFFLIQAFAFLACGVCIYYFRKYSINYIFIFGIDPKHKMNEYQLLKIFAFLFFIWIWMAVCEILTIRGYLPIFNKGETSGFALAMTILMIGFLINPFPILYSAFRKELLYALF